MFPKSIGFVGGGRITRVLLDGWQRAALEFSSVVVADSDAGAIKRLRDLSPCVKVAASNREAAGQQIVFLALHPPAITETLGQMAPALRNDSIMVSLAPKVTMAKVSELLGGFGRIVRVIPNAPSIVGCGFNPLAIAPTLGMEDRTVVRELLAPLGRAPEVPEAALEAYAVIAAMGPTYVWPQLAELMSLGQAFGLSPEDARTAVTEMVRGAAAAVAKSGLTTDELLNLVPVHPLSEFEPVMREAYRTKLSAVHEKLRS